MRNRGPDRPPAFEVCLDQANTFRYGAGADLFGDGKQEVAVLSATQLRIFTNLDGVFNAANVSNVGVSSNARTVLAGNLDKAGSVKPNTLTASPSRLAFAASAGSPSATRTVELSNSASADPIPLRVRSSPQPSFVRWSLSSTSTPATLTVWADAAELLPDITYAADLIVDSAGPNVSNTPLRISVLVKVEKGLVVKPANGTVLVSPCTQPAAPLAVDLRVLGSGGMTFTAEVAPGPVTALQPGAQTPAAISWPIGDVPWISSAESPTTTVPSTITLTLNQPALSFLNQAHVSVNGQLGAESFPRVANITVVCTDYPIYLPFLPVDNWSD